MSHNTADLITRVLSRNLSRVKTMLGLGILSGNELEIFDVSTLLTGTWIKDFDQFSCSHGDDEIPILREFLVM